ncbi:hypothetical protein Tco_1166820 [Tanacetum coccineum]
MTKSLANRLNLKKKLYTSNMRPGMKLGDHIDEFNKLILDLANIDIEIKVEDQALMLLTSLSSSYKSLWKHCCMRGSLTMEDVLATLNSRELKKRTKGIKEETSNGLYGHLKRDCPMKKSSGFVRKGKHNQDSDSSDDEGNAHFREALVIVRNDEMAELVMDSHGTCTIKGIGKVKIQLHDISSFILGDQRLSGYDDWNQEKELCVYIGRKSDDFCIQKHGGSKQVGFKQLGSKQVGFKQLGHGVETIVHGVQVHKRVWFEVEL